MQGDKIQGIVPILVTPFEPDGAIDTKSLANLVEFNIAAGVHGLGVAIGSEVFKLNEAERATVIRCVVETARAECRSSSTPAPRERTSRSIIPRPPRTPVPTR